MRKTRKSLIVLAATAVLFGAFLTGGALAAEIRFNATLSTPNASVRISNIPCGHYGRYPVKKVVVRRNGYYEIGKADLRIARRLASFTGIEAREFVRLRRYGNSWIEVGRLLRIPLPVVRAAFSQKSWVSFLRDKRRRAMYGRGGNGAYRVELNYGKGCGR